MRVLIDSNVLIDLIDETLSWHDWSASQASAILNAEGALVINPIIYAEVSIPFLNADTVEALLAPFDREGLPFEAAFLAARLFRPIVGGAVFGLRPCLTSSSAPTPWSPDTGC